MAEFAVAVFVVGLLSFGFGVSVGLMGVGEAGPLPKRWIRPKDATFRRRRVSNVITRNVHSFKGLTDAMSGIEERERAWRKENAARRAESRQRAADLNNLPNK